MISLIYVIEMTQNKDKSHHLLHCACTDCKWVPQLSYIHLVKMNHTECVRNIYQNCVSIHVFHASTSMYYVNIHVSPVLYPPLYNHQVGAQLPQLHNPYILQSISKFTKLCACTGPADHTTISKSLRVYKATYIGEEVRYISLRRTIDIIPMAELRSDMAYFLHLA